MAVIAHYWLAPDGRMMMSPPEERGIATPWIVLRDGKILLHVAEGGAFHSYEIAAAGLARLASEATGYFWSREQELAKASARPVSLPPVKGEG